nr:hypothetical protein [uncultured Flavobacterium sp.]
MKYYNPQRTFIHEIGHFVARELNLNLYKVGYGVEKIYISAKDNLTYGSGGTVPIKPKNYNNSDPVKNPVELCAVLIYGCLFQSLYLNTEFNFCFQVQDNANGKIDAEHFISLEKNSKKRGLMIDFVAKEFIELINSEPSHFEIIKKLNFENYIASVNLKGDYIINLDKLKIDLIPFLEEHSKFYKKLVIKFHDINKS